MRIHLASLLAGGLLVAGGLALAQAPSWLRPVDAGVTANTSNLIVTSDDANPGRIIAWTFNGQQLLGVSAHTTNPDGVVVSQELKLLTAPRVR
jgi:hypothetical protein